MSILPLPDNVRAQIRSSVEIISLADVVEELFKNALDAGAANVTIAVDFAKGFCSLRDDGSGIPSSEFAPIGHLAQLHCTSKFERSSYGRNGRFLYCLSALSILSIFSRHRSEPTSSSIVLQHSSVISRRLGIDEDIEQHGTMVTVHNLFGDLPVRFKQQAARCADPGEVQKLFEALKRLLLSYLLASPSNVNLRLNSGPLHWTLKSRREADQTFSLQKVSNILQQAGTQSPSGIWKMASARAGDTAIRAAVSLVPGPSKRSQFISFGQHPIPARGIGAIIYDAVNGLFDSSTFGLVEENAPSSRSASAKDTRHNQSGLRTKPVKSVDRWPCFYVRVDKRSENLLPLLPVHQDAADDLPASLQRILALIRLLFERFLQANQFRLKHLRTRKQVHRKRTETPRPESSNSTFDGWKRRKSAHNVPAEEICGGLPFIGDEFNQEHANEDVRLLLKEIELDPNIFDEDTAPCSNADLPGRMDTVHSAFNADSLTWVNPRTGNAFHLDAYTGCITPPGLLNEADDSITAGQSPAASGRLGQRLPSLPCTSGELALRVQKWPSVVFAPRQEAAVPSSNETQENQDSISVQKIEATTLADARVLRQIDNKFILALLPSTASGISSLILVDQHAADERIKVETFYKQLCSDDPVSLSRPINFEVSDEEMTRFREATVYFESWAVKYHIKYTTAQHRPSTQPALISVIHLPSLIVERCRLEPRILIEMLRKEIWSNKPHRPRTGSERCGASWISCLAHCPEGLLDMVNSRACRSAIMFNDVLTTSQCQELLRRLSQCSLPFRCAHGRPSMTVLTALGKEDGGGLDAQGESFGKQFRRWKTA